MYFVCVKLGNNVTVNLKKYDKICNKATDRK